MEGMKKRDVVDNVITNERLICVRHSITFEVNLEIERKVICIKNFIACSHLTECDSSTNIQNQMNVQNVKTKLYRDEAECEC